MLQAEILENGTLQVIETIHSWCDTQTKFWYYDLENGLQSTHGKKDEVPSTPMTVTRLEWVKSNYIPLAVKQKEQRDLAAANLAEQAIRDPFSVDPDRFEKARRWSTLITASLIKDGSYDSMTREQIVAERVVRYEALKLTLRMPADSEIRAAQMIILDHSDRDENVPQRQSQGG